MQFRDLRAQYLALKPAIDKGLQEVINSTSFILGKPVTELENKLIAKDFSDCVVYMSDDKITVAVPAPAEGLSEAAVARITDTITGETDFTASQLKIIEVREE